MGLGREAKDTVRWAASSKWLDRLARAGLVARGATYVLVGWLALQVAFGHSGKQADRGGAVQEIAGKPFGSVLLWLLGIGLAGLALWRLSEVAFGQGVGERLKSLARFVLYAGLAVTTCSYVLGTSSSAAASSNQQSVSLTASLMKHGGGRTVVAIAGIVLVAIGCYLAYEGLKRKFEADLKLGEMSQATRRAVQKLGTFGGIARGVVFALVGVFLVIAAITYRPAEAKGLDGTLRTLAGTPLGPWLLVVVALGLIAFGLFSMCEARWRRV